MGEVNFKAEIREVKSKKLVCLDKEFHLHLTTPESLILQLGALPSDLNVDVRVKWPDKK